MLTKFSRVFTRLNTTVPFFTSSSELAEQITTHVLNGNCLEWRTSTISTDQLLNTVTSIWLSEFIQESGETFMKSQLIIDDDIARTEYCNLHHHICSDLSVIG